MTDAKPSKSARKREYQALQDLGEQLILLGDQELDAIQTDGYAIWTFGFLNGFNRLYGNLIAVTGKTGGGIYITVGSRNYWQSDGNLFFIQSKVVGRIVNVVYKSLTAWQTATAVHPNGAQDKNSLEGDPRFKSSTDLRLRAGSPWRRRYS